MILVDSQIKERINNKELVISGYNECQLNSVSYDLSIECIVDVSGQSKLEYDLDPGETVLIKTCEKLSIPHDIVGKVVEKNSRMRQGLVVSAPVYQPGHITYAFIRVQNISTNTITLKRGMFIAQIMFENLEKEPDKPYDKQEGASFNEEVEYKGLGNYKAEYEKQTKIFSDKNREKIEDMSQRIYSNVLTIMGILVAIFSLLTMNFQAFHSSMEIGNIIVMNITLAICIVLMMGVILIFVNKAKNKGFLIAYILIIVALVVGLIVAKNLA